jgi:hypothetical protein
MGVDGKRHFLKSKAQFPDLKARAGVRVEAGRRMLTPSNEKGMLR